MVKITRLESKKEFDELLKKSGDKLVVVDFFATWCGPCRQIEPQFSRYSEEFSDVVFAKVDVDDCSDIADAEGVNTMPYFKLYKNGKKVDEMIGANAKKLKELIEKNK